MGLTTKIVLALIALHLIIGFGWLMYQLSPRKGDDDKGDTSNQS